MAEVKVDSGRAYSQKVGVAMSGVHQTVCRSGRVLSEEVTGRIAAYIAVV
jgi:hypothetical protein